MSTEAYASCLINVKSGVQFGNYNPFNHRPTLSTGQINVRCDKETSAFTLSLDPGINQNYRPRFMKNIHNSILQYNLYTNPARTIIWGNGTEGTKTVNADDCKRICRFMIYGKIPARQIKASAGVYNDQITATITY